MQYMKKYIKNIVPATFMMLALGATSCIGDLDVDPIDPNIDTNVDLNGLFNKCYANMALAGTSCSITLPSMSVTFPFVVPFTTTLTPASSPEASTTLPVIWLPVCA